jgi:hypothetical protein
MFVQRDGSGKVVGCFAQLQAGYAEEELADEHPDLVAFLNPPPPTAEELEQQCREAFNRDKLFRAKCISDLAFRLGKAPGQLSAAELAAERDRIAAIYKAL